MISYIFIGVLFILILSIIGNLQSQGKRINWLETENKLRDRRELQKKCVEGLICPQCGNDFVRKGDFYDWDDWTDNLAPDYRKGVRFCCACTYTGLEEEFINTGEDHDR